MREIQLSPTIQAVHLAAAIETHKSRHQHITAEHIFCGITKLEDLAGSPQVLAQIGISKEAFGLIAAETKALISLFEQVGVSPRNLRHEMREMLGDGGFERTEADNRISRTDEVRNAFSRATQLAEEQSAPFVGVHHLLLAILEVGDNKVLELLKEQNIDPEDFVERLKTLEVPVPVSGSAAMLLEHGTDLTQKARDGELPEIVGRYQEILLTIRTLSRKTKNNVLLVGDAGVGKTAIVEGLANRIASGNILEAFQNKTIIQLEVGALVADTKYRGDFESRMKHIIEVAEDDENLILFIDEMHMLIGAGAGGGSAMDGANILKPALTRGRLQLIGATTDAEYRKYIAADPALERRFRVVRVWEPSVDDTFDILKSVAKGLERHHQITILDEAVSAAVTLSAHYIPNRRLPDKAQDVLEEACTLPGFEQISYDPSHKVVPQIVERGVVTADHVRQAISEMTGVPLERLSEKDRDRYLGMKNELGERVVGQEEAIDAVSAAVLRRFAHIGNEERPIGVFFFAGPTGVGKTELAKATADFLFGTRRSLIRLDMSEYSQEHSVMRLVGAPPSYVGYDEGGQLTEALRRAPFSVILLDEIEKAHKNVVQVFLQVFDDGRITDGSGRTIDARNCLFIMTSNLGYQKGIGLAPEQPDSPTRESIISAVRQHFSPEFVNRIDRILDFKPLSNELMPKIVNIHLAPIDKRLEQLGIGFSISDDAVAWLADNGYSKTEGARPLQRLIREQIEDKIGLGLVSETYRQTHILHVVVAEGKENLEIELGGAETRKTGSQ